MSLAPYPYKTMYRLATLTTLALAFFLTALPSFAQVARFEGLGLGPGETTSLALGISADGSTVVGWTLASDGIQQAFRWRDGEMEALDRIPGSEGLQHKAYAASADGSVVVGGTLGRATPDDPSSIAWRWGNGETRVIHDPERCSRYTAAYDISADGSIVVGDCGNGNGQEATRWVDGEMEGLGWLPEATDEWSGADAVSGDGSTVVGNSRNETASAFGSAFHWTEEEGMVKLDEANWALEANGVTPDGSVVVGRNIVGIQAGDVVWRWEEGVGMQQLPLPEGWPLADPTDVSADGSIVVGRGGPPETLGTYPYAFIWTEEAGMRDLKQVLENDFGLDLTGWGDAGNNGIRRMEAWGISDDGTVIVGFGTNPDGILEAWRAEAPFGQPIADEATPEALADVLSAPSPNPASGTSTFTIAVEQGQHVSVEVFDALGRQVQTVYNGALAAGMSETLTLDASALPAGVYIIRATGEDFTRTRRVTVVR